MIKNILLCIFFFCFIVNGTGQIEKTTAQVGVSVLPIYDVLNIFPKNSISGVSLTGNLGYLTIKKLSVGILPFYAQASNSYTLSNYEREKQNIKLYGLNTYLRYYFISKEKFLFYAQLSAGFGNFEQITSNPTSLITNKNSHTNTSIFTTLFGVGANYFIAKNFAIELNVPYIYVKQITVDPNTNDFKAVLPAIGFQYYWK